jgi:hypothetical protein
VTTDCTPAERLTAELLRFALAVGGRTPRTARVEVIYSDDPGDRAELLVPAGRFAAIARAAVTEGLCPAEQAIVEVMNALDPGETLSGEEVALRAGYRYGGWFSQRIRKLVLRGMVRGHGRNGYGPTTEEDNHA